MLKRYHSASHFDFYIHAARHPLAPWLATGGAHTGGAYYTIDVDSLFIIDYYGGQSPLSLKDYLAVDPQSFVLREDK